MLAHLSIRNIVLIEKAEIDFAKGLCVLTGETGAGKSILLDSLGLVLGNRADARLVRAGEEKAMVSACFEVAPLLQAGSTLADEDSLADILEELGIETEEGELVIRRTLAADGKSKAFANDTPVSAKSLKRLGEFLVAIHGQHQQRGLMDEASHGRILDAYGQLEGLLASTQTAYRAWDEAKKTLAELEQAIEQASRDRDYLEHMQRELEILKPEAGEEEALTDARTSMMQSEKLAGVLDDALQSLSQPRDVAEGLRSAQSILSRSILKDAAIFSPAIDALEKALIEVEEARGALEDLGNCSGYDQQELERTEERLFALKDAGRKYNLPLDELPVLLAEVTEKLETLEGQEHRLGALQKEVNSSRSTYVAAAEALRTARTKVAQGFEKALHEELAPLKMQATRFQVVSTPRPESAWNGRGMDAISFEVATNKGAEFGALGAIASGGELSRFMLALTVVLSGVRSVPTMIFDEIDTGTGGAVADAIGKRLQRMGAVAQVLVVTHLPQVAARGNQHLFIEKHEEDAHTTTCLTELDAAARHEELARMMSGAEVTAEARSAAAKLIESAA